MTAPSPSHFTIFDGNHFVNEKDQMARISPAWLPFRPSPLSPHSRPRSLSQSWFHSFTRKTEWLKTRLDNRALLSLTGEDSQSFLQGLITTNATKIASNPAATYTAFLSPPGRLLFDVFVYPVSEPEAGFLIDHHLGPGDELYKWLRRFVLRSRVKITKDEREVWALWPNGEVDAQTELQSALSLPEAVQHVWKDRRGDGKLGYRAFGNLTARLDLPNLANLPNASLSAYALHVLLHGSLPPSLSPPYPVTLPFEANLDYHDAVDFRKGCYVGQELTARTYHTGVIRKRLVPVAISKAGMPASKAVLGSIPIANTRLENEVTVVLQNAELKLDGPTLDTVKKTKALGKLCGPVLSAGAERFGLALLRIDHDAFSLAEWPVLRVVGHEEWAVRPLKPHWWPQDV